jgi:hypothetical protein
MKFEMVLNVKKVTGLYFDIFMSFGGERNDGLMLSFHTTPDKQQGVLITHKKFW